MESPGVLAGDSPVEQDDSAYPCKGCGEILEEGKAFELAGNRWHIDCFRCNTCGTLLDSDANLLLLGDGSLICNGCTYSCNACGNKIEDLAILTGDQAFCAACFRCRNCKRKIDNLRYARTSQGIFCMTCHETLMARRRKKSRAAAAAAAAALQKVPASAQSPMLLDKSLPSLPPSAAPEDMLSPDGDTPPSEYTDTPTELSPRPRPAEPRKEPSRSRPREPAPAPASLDHAKRDLSSPTPGHATNGLSFTSPRSDTSSAGVDPLHAFHIPLVLDTGPPLDANAPSHVPRPDGLANGPSGEPDDEGAAERDYFVAKRPAARHQKFIKQPISPTTSAREELERKASTSSAPVPGPVAAVQERRRQASAESVDTGRARDRSRLRIEPRSGSNSPSPPDDTRLQHARPPTPRHAGKPASAHADGFKLQEVPRARKASTPGRTSKSETQSPVGGPAPGTGLSRTLSGSTRATAKRPTDLLVSVPRPEQKTLIDAPPNGTPRSSSESRKRDEASTASARSSSPANSSQLLLPQRADSLRARDSRQAGARRDGTSGPPPRTSSASPHPHEHASATGTRSESSATGSVSSGGARAGSRAEDFPLPPRHDNAVPAPRPQNRSTPGKLTVEESFTTPRAPPQPPVSHVLSPGHHAHVDAPPSPALPQHLHGGDLAMDDDMARILGGNDEGSASLLRRVSNAVRHGRSFSDMENRARAPGVKWPREPPNGHATVEERDGPVSRSPEAKEELATLRAELRQSQRRIAELESRLDGTADMKSLETKLREKRSTMAFLDSQKELVIRELEVLTEHVAFAKGSHRPTDVEALTSKMVRDFVQSLERVKETYGPEVEGLMRSKNQLIEDTAALARSREQAVEETEQLNLKNAQLADLNNELTHQIQERYKANRDQGLAGLESPRPPNGGLGLFPTLPPPPLPPTTGRQLDPAAEVREPRPGTGYAASNSSSAQGLAAEQHEGEQAAVLASPHVVNIRKGQVKKFNWKKGGQQVAKGVSKGFKGAFSSTNPQHQQAGYAREGQMVEGTPYSMHQGDSPGSGNGGTPRATVDRDPTRQGLGFFGQRMAKGVQGKVQPNGHVSGYAAEAPGALFGSELSDRADAERRHIPGVVTRCIEEVELRGMDVEGIYRKTGGNSQVKAIQEGFERSDDYDISDPCLDITAVTSVLKQYLRRLPTPLLTYDIYDPMLESNSILDEEKRALAMRTAVQQLPQKHRDCLEFLVFHLARVATREKENLMTPKNLAVVFAPTIMRDTSLEREMSDMHAKNAAIQFLIENNKFIFAGA
ncbi:MAG: Rho-type gtpase-activating protein [Thelocarpon impressellum]|nr:MAG: Rho-type gtpase-activating protein [Thelocarpon impressellum]